MEMIDKEYLRRMGRRFNYPECCIDFFIKNWEILPAINKGRKAEYGGKHPFPGYVPCDYHWNKILTGEFKPKFNRGVIEK